MSQVLLHSCSYPDYMHSVISVLSINKLMLCWLIQDNTICYYKFDSLVDISSSATSEFCNLIAYWLIFPLQLHLNLVISRLLLKYCFEKLRSTQVAVIHCSAQTSPTHIIQKLGQACMVITTNTGRMYKPKDCEKLILYLKDLNLPKPDKWGTSQLIAFLQQVIFPCDHIRISSRIGGFLWLVYK